MAQGAAVLNYLTIEALEDGLTAKLSLNACEYRVDDGSWTTLSANTNTVSINTGQTLSFRGNLKPASNVGIGTFTISKKCKIKGTCMSLLFGDEGRIHGLDGYDYAFYALFDGCSNIVSVDLLLLPSNVLSPNCYMFMFRNCTSLENAPNLPAYTLTTYCYAGMFRNCTALKQVSSLRATTLAERCYSAMFDACISLTKIDSGILPATTLKNWCYDRMFLNCIALTTAPELPATTLIADCYYQMFYGCTNLNYIKAMFTISPTATYMWSWVYGVPSTGTFVKNKDATWNNSFGTDAIPSGWTVITE